MHSNLLTNACCISNIHFQSTLQFARHLIFFFHLILLIYIFATILVGRGYYFHFTDVETVRMAIIKKSINNKYWSRCREKGTLLHCWWECKLIQPLWTTVRRFLKKLKIELPCDPTIPLLGIYLEKTIIQKESCTPMFTCSTTYNSQDTETT